MIPEKGSRRTACRWLLTSLELKGKTMQKEGMSLSKGLRGQNENSRFGTGVTMTSM